MQELLPYAPPSFVRHGPVGVPGGGVGTPAARSPRTGVGDIQGPFDSLSVYATLPVAWDQAWIRLVGLHNTAQVPLDLKQGQDIQLPHESPTGPAGGPLTGVRSGLLFHVSGRPFTRYEVQVFNPAGAALVAGEFVLVGNPPGSAPTGDRAHRPVVDLQARPAQQQPFVVLAGVVGAAQPMGAANPNGGHLLISSLTWTAQAGAATLEILSGAALVLRAAYSVPAGGGTVSQSWPVPLTTAARGDAWSYRLTGGGPHSLSVQIHQE